MFMNSQLVHRLAQRQKVWCAYITCLYSIPNKWWRSHPAYDGIQKAQCLATVEPYWKNDANLTPRGFSLCHRQIHCKCIICVMIWEGKPTFFLRSRDFHILNVQLKWGQGSSSISPKGHLSVIVHDTSGKDPSHAEIFLDFSLCITF